MPGNGKRGGQIAPGKSLLCPCGGVVDWRAAAQPVLKCGAVFAYVVQSSGIARLMEAPNAAPNSAASAPVPDKCSETV